MSGDAGDENARPSTVESELEKEKAENQKLRLLLARQQKERNLADVNFKKELDEQGKEIKQELAQQRQDKAAKTLVAIKPKVKAALKAFQKKTKEEESKAQQDRLAKAAAAQQRAIDKYAKTTYNSFDCEEEDEESVVSATAIFSDFDEEEDAEVEDAEEEDAEEDAELIVPPNRNYCTMECVGKKDSHATEVTAILNHRHYANKKEPEFMIEYDNGERIWSMRTSVFKDGKELLRKYLEKENLLQTEFAPPSFKRQKNGSTQKREAKVVGKIISVREAKGSQTLSCDHYNWYAFDDETNAKYCAAGYQYHGKTCGKCKARCVSSVKEMIEHKYGDCPYPVKEPIERKYGKWYRELCFV